MKEQQAPHFRDLSRKESNEALKNHMNLILSNADRILKEKNISRTELAMRMGSEKSHISRMFRNRDYGNGLTINVLGRLAIALDVKLVDLIAEA